MRNSRIKVSVVIPTFNRPRQLIHSVYSVLSQCLHGVEVIVVDDNDMHEICLSTRRALFAINDNRVRYLRNKHQKGGCGARNTGIENAAGEFIQFLDDDDQLLPGALRSQIALLAANKYAVLSFGAAHVVDLVFDRQFVNHLDRDEVNFMDMLNGYCAPTSSVVMARKSALLAAGLFDNSLSSFQDLDMWLRVSKFGKIVCHKQPVARFIQHAGERTSINQSRRLMGLNQFYEKWKLDLQGSSQLEGFRARFIGRMYLDNGQLLLASGLRNRTESLGLILKACRVSPSNRWSLVVRLVLACFGFHATRLCLQIRDRFS